MGTQKQYHERTPFSLKVNAEEGNAKDKWHLFLYFGVFEFVFFLSFFFFITIGFFLGGVGNVQLSKCINWLS